MSLCWDCDQEITFLTVKGIVRPKHESGRCGEYRKTARPTKCPKCSQTVFFVEHNGGSVWFDELGPPWAKHPCLDNGSSGTNAPTPYTLSDLKADAKERRCHFCPKMVKPWLYKSHVIGIHRLSPAAIISAEAFEKAQALRKQQEPSKRDVQLEPPHPRNTSKIPK
jgi:hypothetical protein